MLGLDPELRALLDKLGVGEAWRAGAACAGFGWPDAWFPDPGEPVPLGALRACAICPARGECLDYALEAKVGHGVWAGLTAAEIRGIRDRIRAGRDHITETGRALAKARRRALLGQTVVYRPARSDEDDDEQGRHGRADAA